MAKRSKVSSDLGTHSLEAEVFQPIEEIIEEQIPQVADSQPEPQEEWVVLRNLIPAQVSVAGPSGAVYDFARSGNEVKVRKQDADSLLAKIRKGCCGSRPEPWFELVDKE